MINFVPRYISCIATDSATRILLVHARVVSWAFKLCSRDCEASLSLHIRLVISLSDICYFLITSGMLMVLLLLPSALSFLLLACFARVLVVLRLIQEITLLALLLASTCRTQTYVVIRIREVLRRRHWRTQLRDIEISIRLTDSSINWCAW